MKILVTGGTGFIGSHACVELLENGQDVVIIDDLSNSKKEVVDYIETITNRKVAFYEGNVCDKEILRTIFTKHDIDAVIHFAGYKAVGESVTLPLKYYRNNIDNTLSLCEVMDEYHCHNLIFSSSATVYGTPQSCPISEDMPVGSVTNPYGRTKLMVEDILQDIHIADSSWNIVLLRYFNPIGAHESGLIGENPNDIPNNLMPYIMQVATKKLPVLHIFGNDYDTIDGTGVRDYIDVVDLAKGHVAALKCIQENKGLSIYNLGSGNGYSVLEVLHAFEKANGVTIPFQIDARRAGDVAENYADASKAKKELGWEATRTLEEMCKESWNFIKHKQ